MDRRNFLIFGAALATTPVFAQQYPTEPKDIVARLYAICAGKDGSYEHGDSAFDSKAVRTRYFSTPFRTLVERAEKAAKGEVWLDMDPVMNSQDPQKPNTLDITAESASDDKSVVVAKFDQFKAKIEVRYDFVRENGAWKLDDIRGQADGKDHYSVRKTATESLKILPMKG